MAELDRRLERPGAEVAFADTGAGGRTVVLTHGSGMDHTTFDEQARALGGAGYRVVTWDLRGHGASTITPGARFTAPDALADLDALLTECRIDRPVLIGHSLGGNLAQAFVRAHPDRTSGLMVLDSTWNSGPLTRLERLSLRLAAPSLALIPSSTLPGLMARTSATSPAAIERTEAVLARMPKPVFLDVWRAAVSLVQPDPGYRSPVPLALLRGERDRTGNIATAMPRWAQAEGITEHVIPDAGHIVTWDAPDATTQVLLRILGEWP